MLYADTITIGVVMVLSRFVLMMAGALSLGACSSKRPNTPVPADGKRSESYMFVQDVVPLVGGHAYAIAMTNKLWYLNGSTALPVRVLGDSATRARFDQGILPQVQPTSDGGAYAFSITGGVWRLDGDSARFVRLDGSVEMSPRAQLLPADNLGFALSVHEHNARLRANRYDQIDTSN